MTTESQSTTTKLEGSEPTLEPCRWCAEGDTPKFLDRDGTLVSITGNEGVLSHAHEEYWWPCLKFGVEIRSARVSANTVPTVDDDTLGSAVLTLLNAYHGSGHGGVDVMVSARLRGCEKCNGLSSTLDRAMVMPPAASPVAPQQSKAHYEKAHDARYQMTHPVHPDIVVLWFLALKSHWFDDPNNMFHGQREAAKAYLYKWVETGELADDNTTLEITTAMKFREWLASSWTAPAPSAAIQDETELAKLRQAIGWICDAADAAYIEDSDNARIHEIFNIAAQAAGITRRLPDEYQRFDESGSE